jgi:ubiquinone biosynthesis monooxygenase Coq6
MLHHPVLARRAALLAAQRQPALLALLASPPPSRPPKRALSSSPSATDNDPYDVVIVGAGMVGAAVAALLRAGNPATAALRLALVDRAPPPTALPSLPPPTIPDSRVSTLTPASLAAIARCGAWEGRLRPWSAEFRHMQVWDALGEGYVRWSAAAAAARAGAAGDGGRTASSPIMGAVAENTLLQSALIEAALSKGSEGGGCLDVLAPAAVEALSLPPYSPHERPLHGGTTEGGDDGNATTAATRDRLAELRLGPGSNRVLRARLVVGADGARSRVRELAGIRAPEWPAYGQRAVVATVAVAAGENGLEQTAWQVFLPEGPLALLPVRGTNLANVVWSATPKRAAELEALGAGDAFAAAVDAALRRGGGGGEVGVSAASSALTGAAVAVGKGLAAATSLAAAALGPLLGGGGGTDSTNADANRWRDPPRVVSMPPGAQPPRSFPLTARHAGRYVRPRLALVGDAAHVVHPLAGQGVNLGLGDADALARAISARVACGGDIGSGAFLRGEYEAPRRRANGRMMAALDGVQRLFALGGPAGRGLYRGGGEAAAAAAVAGETELLLGAVRGAGLAALNAFPQLRDAFVLEYAMASGG